MAGRYVLLIMDNSSAHISLMKLPSVMTLRNKIVIFYLPPNTTSKIQPSDAGIIRNIKAYYRRRFNCLLIQRLEQKVLEADKIDVLQAIRLAVAVWTTDVKAETIKNCFRHCIRSADADIVPVAEDDLVAPDVLQNLKH